MAEPEPFVALGLSLLAAQDVLEAVLQEVDAAALCQLKAASAAWCTHARRELCTRLCRYEGASITDLDVECLNNAGRPWEVVIASRQLPQLARLRGYGFVVDVQAVREADRYGRRDAPLGGAALRSCIQGEGDPPRELLLAAVACAASGTVRRVPVQRLREADAIGSLNLDNACLGPIGAALLGLMLPAATSVRSLSIGGNCIGAEGASALAAILKETQITTLSLSFNALCGVALNGRGTYTAEGITKLCEGLKGSAVTSLNVDGHALQIDELKGTKPTEKINLSNKGLKVASAIIIASCIKENGVLKELNLANNQLCGLDSRCRGTYTAEGITKLCEALKGSTVTSLDLANSQLCGLDYWGDGTYTTEGITKLCKALKGSAVTSLDISCNHIRAEGVLSLAAILKETQITTLGLASNALCGLDRRGRGTYTTEGITKLCEGLKGSAVTSLGLSRNGLSDQAKQVVKDASRSGVTIHF